MCQQKQKVFYNKSARNIKEGAIGDSVIVRHNNGWKGGVISDKTLFPQSYLLKMENGNTWRRNRRDFIINNKVNNLYLNETGNTSKDEINADENENDDSDDEEVGKNLLKLKMRYPTRVTKIVAQIMKYEPDMGESVESQIS